jgi:hypothetical protein
MRSDLIAAGMVHHWLTQNAPHLLTEWTFETPEDLKTFIARILAGFQGLDGQFAAQSATAATAIELWGLENVALFGGGMPTPLSAKPDSVLYYTDINPQVVDDAQKLGYPTRQADVKQAADVAALAGAKTAIATGLFHFFDDETLRQVLGNFSQARFHQIIFNSMNHYVEEELAENWKKLGYTLYRRSPQDIAALLPDDWCLQVALPARDFFKYHTSLSRAFSGMTNINHLYMLVRQ